jgi:tetratricopeptide (TPR) repeat protein
MSYILRSLGELEEAEIYSLKALKGDLQAVLARGLKALLPDLRSAEQLTGVWSDKGDSSRAVSLYQHLVHIYTRRLGKLHSITMLCKVNLMEEIYGTGDYDSARAVGADLPVQMLGRYPVRLSIAEIRDLMLLATRHELEIGIILTVVLSNLGKFALEQENYKEAVWFHPSSLMASYEILQQELDQNCPPVDMANLLSLSR